MVDRDAAVRPYVDEAPGAVLHSDSTLTVQEPPRAIALTVMSG